MAYRIQWALCEQLWDIKSIYSTKNRCSDFGLAGDLEYNEKTRRKYELCQKLNLRLIPLYSYKDIQKFIGIKGSI
jgi:hypothetical protein